MSKLPLVVQSCSRYVRELSFSSFVSNLLSQTLRVVRFAMAPAWSWNPVIMYRNISAPDFWDPAKPSLYAENDLLTGMTWDDEFVGEVARTVKACQVFMFFPFYWLCE